MLSLVQFLPPDSNMQHFPQRLRQDWSGGEARIHNQELHRLYQRVDHLSDEDRKALVIVLDNFVKRAKAGRVTAEL